MTQLKRRLAALEGGRSGYPPHEAFVRAMEAEDPDAALDEVWRGWAPRAREACVAELRALGFVPTPFA